MDARLITIDAENVLGFINEACERFSQYSNVALLGKNSTSAEFGELFGVSVRSLHRMRSTGLVSMAVIERIAEHQRIHPTELEPRYYDMVPVLLDA